MSFLKDVQILLARALVKFHSTTIPQALPATLPLPLVGRLIQTMPAMLGVNLVALAESQLKILAPSRTWSYSVADNSYIHARATLPSPRLHGAARGLRARSAPRAATGA